ncbi:hypothetical protein [Paenibacillus sp. cl141a]|nr:hypothetical protein [Paenibacillus sp. cl141a]
MPKVQETALFSYALIQLLDGGSQHKRLSCIESDGSLVSEWMP